MAAKQLADSPAAQQEMLKQMKELSKSVGRPQTPDWIPIKFKLTQGTPDGPPAVGFKARLGKGFGGSKKTEAIQRESDDRGMVDFGVVQPGDMEFQLSRVTGHTQWQATGTLNVLPGTTIEKIIVCPRLDEENAPVILHVDLPPDLKDKKLAILAEFRHDGYTFQPPIHWEPNDPVGSSVPSKAGWFSTLWGPGSDHVEQLQRGNYFAWALGSFGGGMAGGGIARASAPPPFKLDHPYMNLSGADFTRSSTNPDTRPGRYRLECLWAVRPIQHAELSEQDQPALEPFHGERCELLGSVSREESARTNDSERIWRYSLLPGDSNNPFSGRGVMGWQGGLAHLAVAVSYWQEVSAFEVKKGQPNRLDPPLAGDAHRAGAYKAQG